MNVLQVIASMDPSTGGTCQAIRSLVPEFNKLGIHTEVVCLDSPNASFVGKDSFPVHILGAGKGPWQYNPKLIVWLTENINRFDIIVVNGLWLYPSYGVWKALHSLKKKSVGIQKMPKFFIMPHGMLDPWFQNVKGREWKAVRNWIYWKLIENRVISYADGLLFTCEMEMLLARKPFKPYKPKQENNIGYGIEEPPSFSDSMRKAFLEKCPEVENQPYLLFLGRIHYKKGVDLLIKAYANKLKTRPEIRVRMPKLVFAGPGLETPYGQAILDLLVKNPQLKNAVFFSGMLKGDAKWGAIYSCEAFILPSHQENFGIAVVEALACEKPVLISNQVNIWPEIELSASGLITTNSLEGIEQLLESWLNLSSDQKRIMEKQARITFEKYFHVTQAARRMLDVLTDN